MCQVLFLVPSKFLTTGAENEKVLDNDWVKTCQGFCGERCYFQLKRILEPGGFSDRVLTVKTITIQDNNELKTFLRVLGTECQFVSLETETEVKMRKTGNPFVGAVKVTKRNGLVNVNHEERVKRRMKEAGVAPDYEAGETWYLHETTNDGKVIPLCYSKKNPDAKYLQFFPHRSKGTKFMLNGRELTAEEVEKMKTFIPEKDWGEFKQPVITLKMDSIRRIKFRKLDFSK